MSLICPAPDATQGVAIRLSTYVSCEARAIGENGFQALAGGALGTSLLSGLVTIFIALIGYRLLLGPTPHLREGVGWTLRLGIVMALVTSWPAFQTLFYRVAVEGPTELAGILLPASGLPSSDLSGRIQAAYDTMRLGAADMATPPAENAATNTVGQNAAVQQFKFESPLPNTASMLVVSTSGVFAALEIAIGFLLAVGPLAVMALLFRGTSSLFNGWLRALAGSAFALLAAAIVAAIDLVMVESEMGHLETFRFQQTPSFVDPQALTTIVMLFAIVMIVVLAAAIRVAGALKLPDSWVPSLSIALRNMGSQAQQIDRSRTAAASRDAQDGAVIVQGRVAAMAQVLTRATTRESEQLQAQQQFHVPARQSIIADAAGRSERVRTPQRVALGSRRNTMSRTRSGARRDKRT